MSWMFPFVAKFSLGRIFAFESEVMLNLSESSPILQASCRKHFGPPYLDWESRQTLNAV